MAGSETCRGCVYRSVNVTGRSCCDYLLMTGKSRIVQGYTKGVKPGHRCPAYATQDTQLAEKMARDKARKARIAVDSEQIRQAKRQLQRQHAADARAAFQRKLEARQAKMLELYQAGKKDDEIAQAVGCATRTVQKWRCARHLQSNAQKTGARIDDLSEKLAYLYDSGCNDYEIARALSCSRSAVQKWRKTTNRPANLKPKTKGERKKLNWKGAYELYQKGWNDVQIAENIGCSPRSVCSWRQANNLQPNLRKVTRESTKGFTKA